MIQLIPALLPSLINIVKEVVKQKRPDVADTIDKVLSDPDTQVELEKLALEKLKTEQNLIKWEFEDRSSARELAIADVLSDSWLSKNIRPLTLIVLTTGFLVLLGVSVTTEIKTPDTLIELYSSLLTAVYFFYFGGRSVEKTASLIVKAITERRK